MYANLSPFGEGYSHSFSVQSGATSTTSVVIFTKAAKITVTAERNYVVADSADNIQITAYVYDALGNKVGDGTPVFFTIGNKSLLDASLIPTNYNNGSFHQTPIALLNSSISTLRMAQPRFSSAGYQTYVAETTPPSGHTTHRTHRSTAP